MIQGREVVDGGGAGGKWVAGEVGRVMLGAGRRVWKLRTACRGLPALPDVIGGLRLRGSD